MAQDKTIKEKIEGNLTYQYKYDSIWNEYYLFTFEINSKYFKNNIVISEECSLKEGVGKNLKQKIVSILKKNASNFNTNMSYSPFVVIVFPTSDGQIQECFIKWRSNEPLLKSEVIEQIMEEIKTIKLSYENIANGIVYY